MIPEKWVELRTLEIYEFDASPLVVFTVTLPHLHIVDISNT